jgi:GTP-binding protein HflX
VPASKVAASVPVSAVTGEGLDALRAAIEAAVGARSRAYKVHVPHTAGADVGWLYEHAEIVGHDEPDERGTTYEVRVEPRHLAAFNDRFAGRMQAA